MAVRSGTGGAGADCTHCGLPVPAPLRSETGPSFCCTGCRLVYSILGEEGLGDFYRLRERSGGERPGAAVDEAKLADAEVAYRHYDAPDFEARFVEAGEDGTHRVRLFLEGVHCAACVWLMDQLPRVLPGVLESRLDLARQEISLCWDPQRCSLSEVGRYLHRLGYPSHGRGRDAQVARRREDRGEAVRLGVSFAIAGNAMMIAVALYAAELGGGMEPAFERFLVWLSLLLALPAATYGALPFYRAALSGLKMGVPHMDLPISLGILAGFGGSLWATLSGEGEVYFDSVTVLVFLLLLGRWGQRRGQRAALAGAELLAVLTPGTAARVEGASVQTVPVESLLCGELVRVSAGGIFPVDGRLVAGKTHVDQSLLTGESHPVALEAGSRDRVIAGTRNLGGEVDVEVDALGSDTRVAKLVELTDRSGDVRAPVLRVADRISGHFVVAVLAIAAISGVVWWRIDPSRVFDIVISVLIVSCPCALGLATPVALAVARGRAARAGFLLRSSAALERIAGARTLFLDKTGTLTEGNLTVSFAWIDEARVEPEILAGWIETLEAPARHPIARALSRWARSEFDGASPDLAPGSWREIPGRGVEGSIDGARISIERPRRDATGRLREHIGGVLSSGASPVGVHVDGRLVGLFGVDDRIRPEAGEALARFRALGLSPTILSGDHERVVERVARALGIEQWHGAVAPEAKARIVTEARAACMVGDGVNDAPALRAAHAGISVAGGAEVALGVADAHLIRPGLGAVAELVEGARRTLRVVRRNLVFSVAYNGIFATLAVLGHVTPLAAALLMPASSLTVVAASVLSRSFDRPAAQEEVATQSSPSGAEAWARPRSAA